MEPAGFDEELHRLVLRAENYPVLCIAHTCLTPRRCSTTTSHAADSCCAAAKPRDREDYRAYRDWEIALSPISVIQRADGVSAAPWSSTASYVSMDLMSSILMLSILTARHSRGCAYLRAA